MHDGALFLKDSQGTLTHRVLSAIQSKTLFVGKHRAPAHLGWPAPGSLAREAPLRRARDIYRLYEAYHESHFPDFETGQLWGAFDLSTSRSLAERAAMVEMLAVRFGKAAEPVSRTIFGVHQVDLPGAGSLFSRALYYYRAGDSRPPPTPRMPERPCGVDGKPPLDAAGKLKPLTHRFGVRRPVAPNVAAWLRVLEDMVRGR